MSANFSEIVFGGDSNLPDIDWNFLDYTRSNNQAFIDNLSDNHMDQVVHEPTRFRAGNNPSLLHLILTTDCKLIQIFKFGALYGKNDHIFFLNQEIVLGKEKK